MRPLFLVWDAVTGLQDGGSRNVVAIHCHNCGGFIGEPQQISYRLPTDAAPAAPHTRLCVCSPAVIYGPPPGYVTSPGTRSTTRRRE